MTPTGRRQVEADAHERQVWASCHLPAGEEVKQSLPDRHLCRSDSHYWFTQDRRCDRKGLTNMTGMLSSWAFPFFSSASFACCSCLMLIEQFDRLLRRRILTGILLDQDAHFPLCIQVSRLQSAPLPSSPKGLCGPYCHPTLLPAFPFAESTNSTPATCRSPRLPRAFTLPYMKPAY